MTHDPAIWRPRIVAEARKWIGTPYHHEGDVRGIGTDCGMMLVRIFVDLGLVEPFDPRPYNRDHMMHSNDEMYVGLVQRCGGVEFEGAPKPGDVAIWRQGRVYSHGAMVIDWPIVIHAFAPARCVQLEDASRLGTMKSHLHGPIRFFGLWGADG